MRQTTILGPMSTRATVMVLTSVGTMPGDILNIVHPMDMDMVTHMPIDIIIHGDITIITIRPGDTKKSSSMRSDGPSFAGRPWVRRNQSKQEWYGRATVLKGLTTGSYFSHHADDRLVVA